MAKEKKNSEATAENTSAAEIAAEKAIKKRINRRKLKYGSIATAITVVIIVIVVLMNVIVNILSDKVNMSIDLTENGTFEISQQSIDYLESVDEPVSIVCLSDELTFQTSTYIYYKQAYEVLKKYSIYNDNITLEFVDMVENPTYAERYNSIYKGEINAYNIVIESSKRIKVLTLDDLYNSEFNYYSFQYEYVSSKAEQELTSAIMYVTDPDPLKAVVLNCETPAASYDNVLTLLESNGYEVSEIDPLTENIPEDADIVVINAPLNDFDESLIDQLYSFLDNGGQLGKNLIYLAHTQQKETKNIDAFLSEWGLEVGSGIVCDENTNNLYQNYYTVKNYVSANDYSTNLSQANLPVIDYYSRPVNILFDSQDTRSTVALLSTADTGFLYTNEMQEEVQNGNEPEIVNSVQNTMALGRKYRFDEDNNMIYSNVLVIGSADNLHETFTSTTYYNNGDYFVSVLNTMTGKNTGISIVAKELSSTTFDIDVATANKYFWIFIIVVPAAAAIAGIAVFVSRRKK